MFLLLLQSCINKVDEEEPNDRNSPNHQMLRLWYHYYTQQLLDIDMI